MTVDGKTARRVMDLLADGWHLGSRLADRGSEFRVTLAAPTGIEYLGQSAEFPVALRDALAASQG